MDTLNQIQEILQQRTAPIQFKHIYSHTNENMDDEEKQEKNLKKKEKMYNKYGEERTERYVLGNMRADKLTDKSIELKDHIRYDFNPYQNEYVLQSTRKKKTKKNLDKPDVINTRIRKTINRIVREDYNNNILKKDKYDNIKKYESKTSKHSTQIIRTKMFSFEESRKMMIKMVHESLPTCEKINRIVEKEQKYGKNDFYSKRYEKYTNEGYCPCCNEDYETVEHLFAHCQNEDIKEIRQGVYYNLYDVMKRRFGPGTPLPKTFFYDSKNQDDKPNDEWDLYHGIDSKIS